MTRLMILAATVAVAVVLFVVLRPDDDESSATTTTQSNATTRLETVPPPPRPQPSPPAVVRITVRDGLPVGGVRRVTVDRGRRVILVVTSNVVDHIHLHIYDELRDLTPARPARISFRATIVGTVELELEDRHVPLARVTTQP